MTNSLSALVDALAAAPVPPSWQARVAALVAEAERNRLLVLWAESFPTTESRWARCVAMAEAIQAANLAIKRRKPLLVGTFDQVIPLAIIATGARLLTTPEAIRDVLKEWNSCLLKTS